MRDYWTDGDEGLRRRGGERGVGVTEPKAKYHDPVTRARPIVDMWICGLDTISINH